MSWRVGTLFTFYELPMMLFKSDHYDCCITSSELADMLHGVDGAAVSRQSSVSNAENLLISLNDKRSQRVATTLSGFPKIHWSILMVLYSIIVLSFLVDSNQEINQYLNSIQLRVLFSTLVSVGSGAAMLLKDLEDPFRGSFCINLSAKQLDSFEELLEADIAEAESEHKQVGRTALITLDRDRQRPNYNTGNTVYFHLLTGPLGNNTRLLGELFAWTFRKITKSWAAFKSGTWRRRRGPAKAT